MSDPNEDWELFSDHLDMCIQNIDEDYFKVNVNDQEPIWRERVYCYELYHQLRCHLKKEKFNYTLHGEIDKNGNHSICKAFNAFSKKRCPNPDFVVHKPGDTSNLVVIEVKTYKADLKSAKVDIEKIEFFLNAIGEHPYKHGIFLVFGSNDLKKCVIDRLPIKEYKRKESLSNLCILWHKKCNEPPEVIFGEFNGRSKL